jgi:dephospho-CoA kinase
MDRRYPQHSPFILGLTGPIGCGKTTVGDILLELGALERIDADRVVHQLMGPGTPLSTEIARTFGADVVRPDGSVDRTALGQLVFRDRTKLRQLESLTHPMVRRVIRQRVEAYAGQTGVVVVDAVKLLQSDLLPLMDTVWVVQCGQETQMQRLTERRKMSAEDATARLRAQPSFEHEAVSQVIQNNGSLMRLRENVSEAWADLTSVENK